VNIIPTATPAFVIVLERQPSGVGPELWVGSVRDTATGYVVEVPTEVPAWSGHSNVTRQVTIPAYRFGTQFDRLVETLQGLVPVEVAA
jgi:hypothetical protein